MPVTDFPASRALRRTAQSMLAERRSNAESREAPRSQQSLDRRPVTLQCIGHIENKMRIVMTDETGKKSKTLTEDAIKTRRGVSRRALLLGTLGAAGVAGTAARASNTDSDYGNNADLAGRGRSGLTDNDDGSWADQPGRGRGRSRNGSGVTDADNGSVYDQPGSGRGGTY
tara:strand:+ start:1283 stop:1795 length:513 start_codon:yes stop_codon:yes gene_type:complete